MEEPTLRIAALQWSPVFGALDASLRRLDERLRALREVDLAVLPEAALTGYVSPSLAWDLRRFAEPLEGPTAEALSAMAKAHAMALAAPLIERDGARCFNAMVLFDAEGRRVGHWRKRHPWLPERWAAKGDLGSPVVELAGLRVTAAICYDVHFLDEDAALALRDADVLLFPSAWVELPEEDLRAGILPRVARRYGVWVVNANWGPCEPRVGGQGRSMVVAPDGTVATRLASLAEVDAVARATVRKVKAPPRRS